ncbi:MAG TPA: hypothetical protein VGA97_03325 [Acidimicrobiia bacterium]
MRRTALAGLVLATLTALAPAALAESDHGEYRDDFKNPTYSGNDGSLTWDGPWAEIGEDPPDGPDIGWVHVMDDSHCSGNKCLHIYSTGINFNPLGAVRYADTSVFEEATLSYYLDGEVLLNVTVRTQVTTNGSGWQTIDTNTILALGDSSGERTISIDDQLSEGFGVRFVVSGVLNGEVYIDNVMIEGDLVVDPTTTTTTEPTTTTTQPTTTTKPTTPDTRPSTTSTTAPNTTTTTTRPDGGVAPPPNRPTTSTTLAGSPALAGGGLRVGESGVQADFGSDMFGGDLMAPEVLGLTIDYRTAVEVIGAHWVWLLVLMLVITGALVGGIDRKRGKRLSQT